LFYLNRLIQTPQSAFKSALVLSLALHVCFLLLWAPSTVKPLKTVKEDVVVIKLNEPEEKQEPVNIQKNQTLTRKAPATQAAPNAPTAEEWAFASTYTLKNSKGYRHTWGKQVRSMMGTAVEGVDQGQVRFRIEIAPNGSIAKVETLWKTSDKAEVLARKAIYSMPPPPTPTGKTLIFEKTISFTPFATDDTPIYSGDCLPDPPAFINPFAWDGKSPQAMKQNKPAEKPSPEALAECLKQLPQDSIEGVAAHNQRQLDQWESNRLNQKK
jgi:hypothetical protein